jgi:hypothetical protein
MALAGLQGKSRPPEATIDFSFVREEMAHCYGRNGNESVPPEVILKKRHMESIVSTTSTRARAEWFGRSGGSRSNPGERRPTDGQYSIVIFYGADVDSVILGFHF